MKKCGMIAIMLLFAAALLAGCGDGEKPAQNANGTPETTDAPQTLSDLLKSDRAIDCVVLPLAVAEQVSFKTEDDVEIFADYYPGKGENPAGVILVHEIYGSRKDWDALIDDLVAKGYAVLAPDLHNYDDSVDETEGAVKTVHFKIEKDVKAASEFLVDKGIPIDQTVIVNGDQGLGLGPNIKDFCKGSICLDASMYYVPPKRPGVPHYIYTTGFIYCSTQNPDEHDDVVVREIKGESSNWILFETRAKDPTETAAQADILRKRIKAMSISNGYVRTKDDGTIQIIAPETAYEDVMALLKPGKLEFKSEAPKEIYDKYAEAEKGFEKTKDHNHPAPPEGYEVYDMKEGDGVSWILVEAAPSIAAKDFEKFFATEVRGDESAIGFHLHESATQRFEDLTASLKEDGRRLAIILDGEVISAPGISEAIRGGNGIITLGGNNKEKNDRIRERDQVLASLQAGTLARPFKDMQHYLIVSTKGGRAETAIYTYGILGRKFGDFDVNENILRDIEAILAKKEQRD